MWQRIQTVFLTITIIALLISLIQPVWQGQGEGMTIVLTPFYLLSNSQYVYIPYSITAMLAVAGITLSLIEIRRFDNRMLQMKLGALNTLILAAMMIASIWFSSDLTEKYPNGFSYGVGLYMIFAAVICNWIALRFIRRDERMVRDSDRIR
jgi:hypothetical protein